MDGRVRGVEGRFEADAAGAPEALAARARAYLAHSEGVDRVGRLATASQAALTSAMAVVERREAALDLLAADALITLALLEVAREEPTSLCSRAVALRRDVWGGAHD